MLKFDSEAFIKEMESLDGVEETPLDFEEFESWYEEYQKQVDESLKNEQSANKKQASMEELESFFKK